MDTQQSYKEQQEQLKAEQSNMTREEVAELMKKRSEFLLDIDSLQPQEHRWVDRGHVMSCEGANHPNHRAFKRLR